MNDQVARRLGLAMFVPAVLVWTFAGISFISPTVLARPFEIIQPLLGFLLIWYGVGAITLVVMLVSCWRSVSRTTWWMLMAMATVAVVPIVLLLGALLLLNQW
jgi:hypothetical protein